MQPLPPQQRSRSGIRLWLPVGLAVVLLANVLSATALVVGQLTGERRPDAVTGDPHRRPVPHSLEDPHQEEQERREAVHDLLARRAQAILDGDRKAFLATIDPRAERFRAKQKQIFDSLAELPLDVWEYEIDPDGGSLPEPKHLREYGSDAWMPRLVLQYRLEGFDASVVSRTAYLGFVRHPTHGWLIAGSGENDYYGDEEIWRRGPLQVARGSRSLVIGVDIPKKELTAIAAGIDRAEPLVSRIWGRDWSRRAVVLVARTHAEASAIAADHQELTQIAALATVAAGPNGTPPGGTGDRIVIDYQNFRKASGLGRQVVLSHELTHVATRTATSSRVPLWLVEGYADYVGFRSVRMPVRSAAGDLTRAVKAGRTPAHLPSNDDFSTDAEDLSQTYAESWLACRFIAERYGEERLTQLYRSIGGHQGSEAEAEAVALTSVLGIGPTKLTAEWRDYLRKELG